MNEKIKSCTFASPTFLRPRWKTSNWFIFYSRQKQIILNHAKNAPVFFLPACNCCVLLLSVQGRWAAIFQNFSNANWESARTPQNQAPFLAAQRPTSSIGDSRFLQFFHHFGNRPCNCKNNGTRRV